jgi:hypothetical protein
LDFKSWSFISRMRGVLGEPAGGYENGPTATEGGESQVRMR